MWIGSRQAGMRSIPGGRIPVARPNAASTEPSVRVARCETVPRETTMSTTARRS
jgi:hypothetical protein